MKQNENPNEDFNAPKAPSAKGSLSSDFLSEWKLMTSLVKGIYAMVSNLNNNQVQQPSWISVSNAAQMLNMSDWNVRRLINEDKLEARKKDGKSYEVSRNSVTRFLAREL